jgi:hypothetical protein
MGKESAQRCGCPCSSQGSRSRREGARYRPVPPPAVGCDRLGLVASDSFEPVGPTTADEPGALVWALVEAGAGALPVAGVFVWGLPSWVPVTDWLPLLSLLPPPVWAIAV